MSKNTKILLYVDYASQPSRACLSFCELAGIPFELKMTRLAKGDGRKPEYLKINPLGQVPAMQEVDADTGEVLFTLLESHTIMRYLAVTRNVADHWYPYNKDLKKRALIDQYLDWHHTSLRAGCGGTVFKSMFAPAMQGKTYTDEELVEPKRILKNALNELERRLSKTRYLAGDEISIADISAAHELDQTRFVALDLTPWPETKQWLYRVIDEQPVMLKYAKVMRGFAAKAKPRVAKL